MGVVADDVAVVGHSVRHRDDRPLLEHKPVRRGIRRSIHLADDQRMAVVDGHCSPRHTAGFDEVVVPS